MSKQIEDDRANADYTMYLVAKKLKEAQWIGVENPQKLMQLIDEAFEILEEYAEIK